MNLNKVMLLGNLTRDPELRQTPTGQTVCSFSVATNRMWISPNGEKNQKAEFHNVVAWGKLADICGQYLNRGKLVFIEGRIETRSWQDKTSGEKKYRTEIVAESMQMGPRTGGERQGPEAPARESTAGFVPEEPPTIEYAEAGEIEVKDIPF